MSIYTEFVTPSQLISPINGYKCKRVNKQNIKQFGFETVQELHQQFPDFPLICDELRQKLFSTRNNSVRRRYFESLKKRNKEVSDKLRKEYLKHPKKCPGCKGEIDFSKRNNKFCSRKCANSRIQTNEMNLKRSIKLRGKASSTNKNKTKKPRTRICPVYGIEITDVKKHSCLKWSPYPSGRIKTIKLLADTFDIELGKNDTPQRLDSALKTLYEDYHVLKLSSLDIHKKYGFSCSSSHMPNFLKALGIQRRNFSEASTQALLNGKSNISEGGRSNYKTGYHISWDGKEHYYRSSYELDFFKKLDEDRFPYEVESHRFEYFDTVKGKNRIAIPDVVVDKTIYEVKSSYTLDEQNMADKFVSYKKYGYKLFMVYEHKIYEIQTKQDIFNVRLLHKQI